MVDQALLNPHQMQPYVEPSIHLLRLTSGDFGQYFTQVEK